MKLRTFGYVVALFAAGSFAAMGQDLFSGLEATPRKGAKAGDVDIPEIKDVIVQADFNTDYRDETDAAVKADEKDAIEGSVTFVVDVPFRKIVKHMQDPGTLGKISPNIAKYEAKVAGTTDDAVNYKIHEVLTPFKLPLVSLGESTVNLDLTITKRFLKQGRVVVDYSLDKDEKNDWKRFTGSIYGVDLHNGKTMIMVATSTKSNYNILPALRLKLAKHFLGKTKDNIIAWVKNLEAGK